MREVALTRLLLLIWEEPEREWWQLPLCGEEPLLGGTKSPALTLLFFNVLWEIKYELAGCNAQSGSPFHLAWLLQLNAVPLPLAGRHDWQKEKRGGKKKKGIYIEIENKDKICIRLIGYKAILIRCNYFFLEGLCWGFLPCLWNAQCSRAALGLPQTSRCFGQEIFLSYSHLSCRNPSDSKNRTETPRL